MNKPLINYIKDLAGNESSIPSTRLELLDQIATYIQKKKEQRGEVNLIFICTHNSRRSHLSQIWAATFAHYFELEGIKTYSGGTEVTAFNIRAVNALHKAGFGVINPGGSNPHYKVSFSNQALPLVCYSKKFDSPENPQSGFAALMTCSDADDKCPIVAGADIRFSLYYDDPKEADDTPWEGERYEERLKQIGTEIFYLMESVSKKQKG